MKLRKAPTGVHPNLAHPAYKSTIERSPRQPEIPLPQSATELSGPRFDRSVLYPNHDDLTKQTGGEPLGERILALCGARAATLIARLRCSGRQRLRVECLDAGPE